MKAEVIECVGRYTPKYFALRAEIGGILITMRITKHEYRFILEDIVGIGASEDHPKMRTYFERIASFLDVRTE
jgi:hypothetical protein